MHTTVRKSITVVALLSIFSIYLMPAWSADAYIFPEDGKFILPATEKATPRIFHQCSRGSPHPTELWGPSSADIADLEQHLPNYLDEQEKTGKEVPPKASFHRQYIGFIRDGHRYIYGNFYHISEPQFIKSENVSPQVVCDGGSGFWGIVYDPDNQSFSDLELNGQE